MRFIFLKAVFITTSLCASCARAEQDCSTQALRLYDKIITYVAYKNDVGEIDTAIEGLQTLNAKKCFNSSKLDSSLRQYFDTDKNAASESVERSRKQYWKDQFEYLDYLKSKGSSKQLETEAKEILSLYNSINPKGVSLPTNLGQNFGSESDKKAACGEVNSIIAKLPPIRDQGSAKWCYFYSTADLLSFAMNKNISPSYLGHLVNPTGSGGSSAETINAAVKKFGLCLEKTMPSKEFSLDYIGSLRSFNEKALAFKNGQAACPVNSNLLTRMPGALSRNISEIILQSFEPSGKVKDLNIVEGPSSQLSSKVKPAVIQHIVLNQCKDDRANLATESRNLQLKQVSLTKKKDGMLENKEKLLRAVDEQLSQGKPANISYDSSAMFDDPSAVAHWSSIVGRRFVNGQCQYQVRNSYGKADCKKLVSEKDACSPPGYFWVDAGKVFQTIKEVQVLK